MSLPEEPLPAKLVVSIFSSCKKRIEEVAHTLGNAFGPIDCISKWMLFDYTDYYHTEMGSPLYRRMFSFDPLVSQGDLSDIKLFTNKIEQHSAKENRREINIDPGLLILSRFILATGKDFTHRVYIGNGIYADLTLLYQKGAFTTLPWTYPDYADVSMIQYLKQVRKRYVHTLKLMETDHL